MNPDFPPLHIPPPQVEARRPEKPRRSPLPLELLNRREEIARHLGVQVESLNRALRSLSEEQRKAVFYKLVHDNTISLSGTGLKPIAQDRHVTLAIPRDEDLGRLSQKITEFATSPESKGHVKNEALAWLQDIVPGDPKDRLSEKFFAQYDSLVKQDLVVCEIEILSLERGHEQQRKEIQETLQALESAFANRVHGTIFEHEEIKGTCRAVIRCTGSMFRRLVEDEAWQTRISWFDAKPRFETYHRTWNEFSFEALAPIESPPETAPIVCIIDSGVSAGNPFLQPVTREDLLKSFLHSQPDNPYDEHGHGSGVASLAAYYALNLSPDAVNQGRVWIAGARILDGSNQLEEGRLFSRVIEEAVETFVGLGVRIFNLSVADLDKKWNATARRTVPRTSWVARTLDRLARKYDIVFVTCTGNLPISQIKRYYESNSEYPRYLAEEDTRLLDPGQAALALTVGSFARSTLVVHTGSMAIAAEHQPSPFTRSGPGMGREVKPELVEYGGNLVRDLDGTMIRANPGTNVVMASHQLTPAAMHDQGTSFAAPRVAHKLALLQQDLLALDITASAPLLKAFLVNASAYPDIGAIDAFKAGMDQNGRHAELLVAGYGMPDAFRSLTCDEHTAVLYFDGTMEADQVCFFNIPVPEDLSTSAGRKRLTITVAHYPEVQQWGLERYLGVDLKWRVFRGDISRDQVIDGMSRQEDEGKQGSVPDGVVNQDDDKQAPDLPDELRFCYGVQRRSRGTVQHDFLEWTEHKTAYSDGDYTLAIASYKRWQRKTQSVPFAVVVRLEDLGREADIYARVANALTEVQVAARDHH